MRMREMRRVETYEDGDEEEVNDGMVSEKGEGRARVEMTEEE